MWVREVVPARDRLDAEDDDDTGLTLTPADGARGGGWGGGAGRVASSLSSQEVVWVWAYTERLQSSSNKSLWLVTLNFSGTSLSLVKGSSFSSLEELRINNKMPLRPGGMF